ncbi:RNA polymerase sigma-54 factor RpoN [Caballeronia glathei]|jgi:RNA polymerase sigma-70 factor (ECF subfamily)|uniref:RNA polymerase subunit sigma-24 n=1 Tax=Caballeronia glathei TaxID=60547 RepID=A0A069PSK5_9BURK|nr:sigma-70 family RNA polymerase sigma factor [Caballeronia glathei]KDR43708.1 RNA polymerase subunit sigma-24 [Caballeronia glathei]CDY75681.1 RNA polymerase sigma-54 factor RpoN [Caballeronia glathei]
MAVEDDIVNELAHLRRYARALLGDTRRADDLVQDTLERSLRYVTQFRAGTNLRRWLMTIMHNVFVNDLEKYSRQMLHSLAQGRHASAAYGVHGNQIPYLEVRDLDWALQRLPQEQREVILMVGLEDMSYSEVALTLGIPVGTVMSRLSRGRERLRALTSRTRPESRLGATST